MVSDLIKLRNEITTRSELKSYEINFERLDIRSSILDQLHLKLLHVEMETSIKTYIGLTQILPMMSFHPLTVSSTLPHICTVFSVLFYLDLLVPLTFYFDNSHPNPKFVCFLFKMFEIYVCTETLPTNILKYSSSSLQHIRWKFLLTQKSGSRGACSELVCLICCLTPAQWRHPLCGTLDFSAILRMTLCDPRLLNDESLGSSISETRRVEAAK